MQGLNIFTAIFLGVIQGFTELLPVSSSGHLAIAEHYLGVGEPALLAIVLHMGTLAAVIYFYRKDLIHLTKSFFSPARASKGEQRFIINIIIATIPIVIVGLLAQDIIRDSFSSLPLVGISLLATATMLASTKLAKKDPIVGVGQMSYLFALTVGISAECFNHQSIPNAGFNR